jgi:hypothetical protein|nr:hypothetical protein [uncultured Fusobacterium sp.]
MVIVKLTDEEHKLILDLRKKKQISEKEIKENIDNWLKAVDEVEKATIKLYEIYTTSDKAKQIITSNTNSNLFFDLYGMFEDEESDLDD